MTLAEPHLPVGASRGAAVDAALRPLLPGGPLVAMFRLEGGKRRGALGPPEGEMITRLVTDAVDNGVPVVGVLATSGADVTEGVASLHAWGTAARALGRASGVVPIVLVVTGPCVSGPALLLGLADVVVMTQDAFAYVTGPQAVERFTGVETTRMSLGGAAIHGGRTGVASLLADDEDDALQLVEEVLSFLPPNNEEPPPRFVTADPVDRPVHTAVDAVA